MKPEPRFTFVASTDEKHPTYLYFDLESERYFLTKHLAAGGTWIGYTEALNFCNRDDTQVAPRYAPEGYFTLGKEKG